MTFMHEGGMTMWLTLLVFVGALAAGIARRRGDGAQVATLGAIGCLAAGLTGFATGLYNVVAYAESADAPRRAEILGIGLREAVHNVLWAGGLALVLVVFALVASRASGQRSRAVA